MKNEAEDIFKSVKAGTLTPEDAVKKLVALGYDREDATELVYIAAGGDDVVEK